MFRRRILFASLCALSGTQPVAAVNAANRANQRIIDAALTRWSTGPQAGRRASFHSR
jgi:hypothetical protein